MAVGSTEKMPPLGEQLAEYARDYLSTLVPRTCPWHSHLVRRLKSFGENPIREALGMPTVKTASGPWPLGRSSRRKFTDDEMWYVLAEVNSLAEAAQILDVSVSAVWRRLHPEHDIARRRFGGSQELDSGLVTRHSWEKWEDDLVLAHKMRDIVLAQVLGVTEEAVRHRRYALRQRAEES